MSHFGAALAVVFWLVAGISYALVTVDRCHMNAWNIPALVLAAPVGIGLAAGGMADCPK